MRWLACISMVLLTACGGDGPTSESAMSAAEAAAARDAAQAGRIDNPEAMACIRANASEGEWAIIAGQDANAEAMLQTVLQRDGTVQCFGQNNVVVYI